ncbi:Integrin alpha-M, partial [Nibea albiflora]
LLHSSVLKAALCFNIDPVAWSSLSEDAAGFGYQVVQRSSDLLVSAPLEQYAADRRGRIYKCSTTSCHQLSVPQPDFAVNMSLGLTMTSDPVTQNTMACGPTIPKDCQSITMYNGVCFNIDRSDRVGSAVPSSPPECGIEADIAFLLDGSGSVHRDDFQRMKVFVKALIRSFEGKDTQFAISQFSSNFKVHYYFGTISSHYWEAQIDGIHQLGGGTYTARAIKRVVNDVFSSYGGARPNVKRVLIVITDGYSSDRYDLQGASNSAENAKIVRFAIGVGGAFTNPSAKRELETIASSPSNEHVFHVGNFAALETIRKSLQEKIFAIEGSQTDGESLKMEMSQDGFSAAYVPGGFQMGIVGANQWKGGYIKYTSSGMKRGSYEPLNVESDSYLGYSMAVAQTRQGSMTIVGAPRYRHRGVVMVVDPSGNFKKIDPFLWQFQSGEYFGAEVCTMDVDRDTYTDLILISAPMYVDTDREGRVYVCSLSLLNVDCHLDSPSVLRGEASDRGRFGSSLAVLPDLNTDGLNDLAVGAPLEDDGQGSIYIFHGEAGGRISRLHTQRIAGSKVQLGLKFFGMSISQSSFDQSGDLLPDLAVGSKGKVILLRSKPIVMVEATVSFSPSQIPTQNPNCSQPLRTKAEICFTMTKHSSVDKASARINCNFTLDYTRKAPNNRAYISEKQRMTNKSFDINLRQPKCFDVNFFVEPCPEDALNALSNELTFTFEGLPSEITNLSSSLAQQSQTTTFHPLGFEINCGTDNNCVDNLKVDFNFTRSLEVKVGIDELLNVTVSVENSEENSYNSHVIVTYPAGLSFRKFTVLQGRIECNSLDSEGLLEGTTDCTVDKPIFKTNTKAFFIISYGIDTNSQLDKTIFITANATSGNEHSVSSELYKKKSIPVKYSIFVTFESTLSYNNFTFGKDDLGKPVQQSIVVTNDIRTLNFTVVIRVPVKLGDKDIWEDSSSLQFPDCQRDKDEEPLVKDFVAQIQKNKLVDCSVAQCGVFKCNVFMGRLESKTLKISANLSSRWIQQIGLKSAKYLLTSTASLEYDRNQYIFFSTGSNYNPPIHKIETEVQVYPQPDFTKEIIGGSLGGLALLALLTAGLYKAGFFKSKYNKMINANEANPGAPLVLNPALCFNVDPVAWKSLSNNAAGFGYQVVQRSLDVLVSAPLEQYAPNGRGQIYKCSTTSCQKLSVPQPDFAVNMSLGLTMTSDPVTQNTMACGPTIPKDCQSITMYNGVCFNIDRSDRVGSAVPSSPPECRIEADIAFLLDGSGSVYQDDFERMKGFVKDLVRSFVGQDTKFAISQFSRRFMVHYYFDTFSPNNWQQQINGISQLGGGTFTANAIKRVVQDVFSPRRGARPNVRRVLIVITDGESNDRNGLPGASTLAENAKIVRFAIGVGGAFNNRGAKQELETIASSPSNEHVFHVGNFDALETIRKSLQEKIFAIEGSQTDGESLKMEMSQDGFSAAYVPGGFQMGIVGANQWKGGYVKYTSSGMKRGSYEPLNVESDSYLGYSMAVAQTRQGSMTIVGAPRYQHRGVVMVVESSGNFKKIDPFPWQFQSGEYFGAAVCTMDVDRDTYTDLILISAPMYVDTDREGRVYVCSLSLLNVDCHLDSPSVLRGEASDRGRFGSSLAVLPDLNTDGLNDLAVGAPLEDDGQGSIYIFHGEAGGRISRLHTQRIAGSKVQSGLKFFGMSISQSSFDQSGDLLPDLAVGSKGKVILLRPCPEDALNALSNELTFTFEGLPSEISNLSPSLAQQSQTTTFHPLGFEINCGTDNKCVDNLKVDFNFTRSLEVKVGIDELLNVTVSVENSEENSYNSHVIVTYPAGLSFRKFTVLQGRIECNSLDSEGLLEGTTDCTVDKPIFKTNTKAFFIISYGIDTNSQLDKTIFITANATSTLSYNNFTFGKDDLEKPVQQSIVVTNDIRTLNFTVVIRVPVKLGDKDIWADSSSLQDCSVAQCGVFKCNMFMGRLDSKTLKISANLSSRWIQQIEAEVQVYPQPDFTKEIIGGSLGGLALLALLTAGLYKAGFFKSKYNDMINANEADTGAPLECRTEADIAFLLDGSGSVHRDDFERMKVFVKDLVRSFIGQDTQFAISQFSSDFKVHYYFNTFSPNDWQQQINGISQLQQATYTANAIKRVVQNVFSPRRGARPNVRRVLIVITDGASNDRNNLPGASTLAENAKIVRFAIGVGGAFNDLGAKQELETIASSPSNEHVFHVGNFDALETIRKSLQEKIFAIEGSQTGGESLKMEMSQDGFSAAYVPGGFQMGIVGANQWKGGYVKYTRSGRKRGSYEPLNVESDSYLGYSMAVAQTRQGSITIVGAPRYRHRGVVMVVESSGNFKKIDPFPWQFQSGEYFGAEVCTMDVDRDTYTDLILISAPMYVDTDREGRVYVCSLSLLNVDCHLDSPSVLRGEASDRGRFGSSLAVLPDLNTDGLNDLAVGAPLEDDGQGSIYIFHGEAGGRISRLHTQRIAGSKVQLGLKFFGMSISQSSFDQSGDLLPDLAVGSKGKVILLRSKPIVMVEATVSFSPSQIPIQNPDCSQPLRTKAKICFTMTKRSSIDKASARINCNFTLDSTRKAPKNRAYISEKQQMTNKSFDINLRQPKCFDVNFFVEACPEDALNALSNNLTFTFEGLPSEISNLSPSLALEAQTTTFHPLGFEINCGTDNTCVDNLKVDFNFTRSLEVKVGIDELLNVTVSVENSEENSYNSHVIVTYPAGLSFRKFTILQGRIECNSLDSEGLLEGTTDCTVDKPIFKTNTKAFFIISYGIDTNSQLDKTIFITANATSTLSYNNFTFGKDDLEKPVQQSIVVTNDIRTLNFTVVIRVPVKLGDKDIWEDSSSLQFPDCQRDKDEEPLVKDFVAQIQKNKLVDCSVAQCGVFKCNMFMGRLESKTLKISANLSSRWIQQIGLKSAKYLLTSTANLEYDRNQYIFFSTGSNNNPPIHKIEAEVEVYAELDFTKEIIGGSLGGLALLALLTAGLYKAGFFKSKYNDMINAHETDPGAPLGEHEQTPEA